MKFNHACLIAAVAIATLAFTPSDALAQIYEWNGSTSTDWATASNWTEVEDARGTPVNAPALDPPSLVTTTTISMVTGSPVISSGAQEALIVNVGGSAPGRLDITGGSLTTDNDLEIGADSTGTVNINDSNGPVSIVIGDDLNLDRDAPAYNSTLVISGDVTLDINDRVELGAQGAEISEFLFDFQSGLLQAGDDIRVRGGANAEMRVSGGLVEGADSLDVDSLLSLSGDGVVRVERLTDLSDFSGMVTINDDALLQIEDDGQTPFSQIQGYVDDGTFSTSGPALAVQSIVIPEFFGNQDVNFFQVSVVVPEPASGVLFLGLLALAMSTRSRSAT